jgi:hypothetical protein
VHLAQLHAEADLRRRGIDLASHEGEAILANIARIEQLTSAIDQQKEAQRALENVVSSALDRFGDVLVQGRLDWDAWGDAARSVLQDIAQEMVKLAVLNPLKNLLFNSSLPTLGDAGGFFGNLIASVHHSGGMAGLGPRRPMPALAFARAPRFHSGAFLQPDEVPAILQRGERVLDRRETAAYNRKEAGRAAPIVSITIQTPHPAAFEASKGQIAAQLARAVRAGMRGN